MRVAASAVTSVVAGGALGVPTLLALGYWLQGLSLLPSTPIEVAVFSLVLLRAVLFFGVPGFRRSKSSVPLLVLSGDILVLPMAVALYYATGDAGFASFGVQYLGAWLSASLLLYPPVLTLVIADGMRRRSKLVAVLPAAAGEFVLSTLVLRGVSGLGAPGSQEGESLSSVARLALGNMKGQPAPSPETSLLIMGCGALLFASLAAYSVTTAPARGGLIPELVMCVVGIAALLGWIQLTLPLQPWEAFGLPTAVILGISWVVTREG